MHLSSDGKLLFASTEDGKMVEYTVDALSGFLTKAGSIDAGTEGFGNLLFLQTVKISTLTVDLRAFILRRHCLRFPTPAIPPK